MQRKKKILRFSLQGVSVTQRYAFVAGLLSMLLLGWAAVAALLNLPFSLFTIAQIHSHLFVWIYDGALLLTPSACLWLWHRHYSTEARLRRELNLLKQQVQESKNVAQQIGSGTWSESIANESTGLSKTLVDLGRNLKETKQKEEEHNWVAFGKEQLSDTMRLYPRIEELAFPTLKRTIEYFGAVQGAFYLLKNNHLEGVAYYAYHRRRFEKQSIPVGKGLVGVAAYERQLIYRTEIPDDYFTLSSGLIGAQKPDTLLIFPLLQEQEVQGVIEIGFLQESLPKHYLLLAQELSGVIGSTVYNLKINARTELLLHESQQMTSTLRANEELLRKNAEEMMAAQEELEHSNQRLATQIQEVEHGQKRLQALLANASEFISIYNENRELIFESPSVRRILGYTAEDGISGMEPDLLTPRGFKTLTGLFDYLLSTPGGEQTAQYTYLKKNGQKIFLETQGKNLLHDPAIRGLIFNTQDITERIRAEKEERMKSRMQSLSENSPDMIIRMNGLGRLVYVNPVAASFFGLAAAGLIRKRMSELAIDQSFADFVIHALKRIKHDQQQVVSELEVNVGHEARTVEVTAIPELGEEDELETVLFVVHDVTEFKRIEAEIKEKNKKISDSINYAQRIQTAILPDTGLLQNYFPRSFVFYRPKDVVSGDFPWFFHFNEVYYVAAVDCTGHGVPGALLSFIGYFLLNNIVNSGRDLTAAQVLDQLHAAVRATLRQDQDGANGRDGMDLALIRIDRASNELQFAGAHRPLYFLRNGELTEYKGSRKGIGGIPLAKKTESDFENNVIDMQPGDRLFIFSDGLSDQLGGPERKKYQSKRIRDALESNVHSTMPALAHHFSHDFYEWMGPEKQVDDVLLIGIEL